ncbi:MAG: adenylate cyclase [Pseudomonadota bacterium]
MSVNSVEEIYSFCDELDIAQIADCGLFVMAPNRSTLITGPVFEQIVPLLDGQQTVGQLANKLARRYSLAEIIFGIEKLDRDGYLVKVHSGQQQPAISSRETAKAPGVTPQAWQVEPHATPDPALTINARNPLGIHIRPLNEYDWRGFRAGLSPRGLFEVEQHSSAACTILLTDNIHASSLEKAIADMTMVGARFIFIAADGWRTVLSPIFHAGRHDSPDDGSSACAHCVMTALRRNSPVRGFIHQHAERVQYSRFTHLDMRDTDKLQYADAKALDLLAQSLRRGSPNAAHNVERAAKQNDEATSVTVIDRSSGVSSSHVVRRLVSCQACGQPDLRRSWQIEPISLRPRTALSDDHGGFRVASQPDTLRRLRKLVDPVTGALASAGPLPGRPPIRPVYAASFLISPKLRNPGFDDFHGTSLGKGASSEQAECSALCEAVERSVSITRGDEPTIRATARELGSSAVAITDLLNFSEHQYAQRGEFNAHTADARRAVPLPPDDTIELDWTQVWSLTHGQKKFVPSTYCFSRFDCEPSERICSFNPNGHASGNCLEEAILHALFELVERDSVALWWYNMASRPGVDLASFDDEYFDELVRHYAETGWDLWVLDLTTDMAIPAFAALAFNRVEDRVSIGFGAHLDARIAIKRAVTEVNQLLDLEPRRKRPWSGGSHDITEYLVPSTTLPRRRMQDYVKPSSRNIDDAIRICVDRAANAGMEVLALDLTDPDIDLSVAKVIVPGLRHFWPRFGPGRLYDTPLTLGWVSTIKTEAELNPAHLFL